MEKRSQTINGLWTNNFRYNLKIFLMLTALEIILAFSPMGFVRVHAISLTTLHLIVMATALWGGPLAGGALGFIFGLCSMWKAEVTAVNAADLVFAPSKSGNVFGSIMLSAGSRVLFGIIAGFVFWILMQSPKKRQLPFVLLASAVLDRVHAMCVYFVMGMTFPETRESAEAAYYNLPAANKLLGMFVTIVVIFAFYELYDRHSAKKYYEEYQEICSLIEKRETNSVYIIVLPVLTMLLISYHMADSIKIVWGIEGIKLSAVGKLRLYNVIGQFVMAICAAWGCFMEFVQHKRELEEARSIKEQKSIKDMQLEMERKANEAKTVFLSSMSHDIRTPMNAIVGMTEIAKRNFGDEARMQDCLRKISLASNHLLMLINDILDISKIEAGTMKLNMGRLVIPECTENLSSIMMPLVRDKGLSFEFYAKNIKTEVVYGDELRISQIWLNLLSNAVKYTETGGKITASIEELPSEKGEAWSRYIFQVADTGVGISAEYLKNIYEPFSRENDGRIDKVEGSGLGLAITKRIVDMMDGQIDIQSAPGKGSTFTIHVDMKKYTEDSDGIAIEPFSLILIEHDEEMAREGQNVLEHDGVQVVRFQNGKEAIEYLVKDEGRMTCNAILIDRTVPGENLALTIRTLCSVTEERIPVFVAAYDWSDIEETVMAAGAKGFISKPYYHWNMVKLVQTLHQTNAYENHEVLKEEQLAGLNVLVAEDIDFNWEVADEQLQDYEIHSIRAKNGLECVNMVKDAPAGTYQLILMDVQMPVMNGYDATKAIREIPDETKSRIPIIAMTADAFTEDIQLAKDAGMDGHIAKPITMKRVLAEMNRVLSNRGW